MEARPDIEGVRLTGFLARGAWGEVYAGERVPDGLPVAVKLLHAHLTGDPVAVGRMMQEGRLCWSLDHPNVIRTLSWGRAADGRVFLVMERLFGETVESVVRSQGALPTAAVLEIARGLAAGLRAIHRRAVHRDIKPNNVFLAHGRAERRCVKILDLGIASLPQDDPDRLVQTAAGEVVGAPAYMAPERLLTGVTDARIDLYAMGATLFECLTGGPPYAGTPLSVAVQVCRALGPPALPALDIPVELRDLVIRLMAPNPDDRPASCDEVLECLGRLEGRLELDRWTSSTGAAGPTIKAAPISGDTFLDVARATVHQHYHPDHVPPEIAQRLQALAQADAAVAAARTRCEGKERAAADLACRLEAQARSLALELGRSAAMQAEAEQRLDAARREHQVVGEAIRELDASYAAACEAFHDAAQRAHQLALERGEPLDAGGIEGQEATAVLAALDDVARQRARLVVRERVLSERVEVERVGAASCARAAYDVRQALAAVEIDRECTLGLLEREARDAEDALERQICDLALAQMELGVSLQRVAFT